jgi:hypothetical protein
MSNNNAEWMNRVNKDYEPVPRPIGSPGGAIPPPHISERRAAHAAEYSAYQLGQINKKLDRLIEAIEKLASRP